MKLRLTEPFEGRNVEDIYDRITVPVGEYEITDTLGKIVAVEVAGTEVEIDLSSRDAGWEVY